MAYETVSDPDWLIECFPCQQYHHLGIPSIMEFPDITFQYSDLIEIPVLTPEVLCADFDMKRTNIQASLFDGAMLSRTNPTAETLFTISQIQ